MNSHFQEALRVSSEYLEKALVEKSFHPEKSPLWALMSVKEVFQKSLLKRTKNLIYKYKPEDHSDNGYVKALWYLYPFVQGKETPLPFLAVVRFLNLLGKLGNSPMSEADRNTGEDVLKTLQMLQNAEPEEVIASAIHARLGIHLNS